MKPVKRVATPSSKDDPGSFIGKLRKRRIIETLAAFIAGGWLIIEVVHFILIGHYHFPEKTLDVTIVTLLCALACTLIWRWFSGREKPRKFKLELVLIPLLVLVTVFLDINLLLHLKGPESETFPAAKWKNSIAVLPFVDMSPQKDQEYFCDGMAEELINRLSNIRELKVPARTSAFMFKGKAEDIREIGRKLDVRTVLEGSIRKVGNQLRVTAQLINIADGFHLWSDTFDRELKDVFKIQDEIALAIADKLKLTLLGDEKAKVTQRHTDNVEANILYLRGKYLHLTYTPEGMEKAIELFEQAIQKDPNYALAYSGLADTYYDFSALGLILPKEAIPRAKTYLKKALDIDENLAETHASLGRIIAMYEWNWAEAEQEFKRALELNLNSSIIYYDHCASLTVTRRFEEAIREAERARELDPLSSQINSGVGEQFYFAGQFDRAIEDLKKTIMMDPDQYYPHLLLGLSYQGKHMMKESVAELEKAFKLPGGDNPMATSFLTVVYYRSGAKAKADGLFESLNERAKHEYVPSFFLFFTNKARGDLDQAFKWLERACQDRDILLPYGLVWPDDSFRIPYDQRSAELLRRVGLLKTAEE
jgi:TolB-like protein/Flp pilus assembly protein TadD